MSHREDVFGGLGHSLGDCSVSGKIDSGRLEDNDFVIAFSF